MVDVSLSQSVLFFGYISHKNGSVVLENNAGAKETLFFFPISSLFH